MKVDRSVIVLGVIAGIPVRESKASTSSSLSLDNSAFPTPVGVGTWKRTDVSYEITLPGNTPDTFEVTPTDDGVLQLPRDGHVLIFNKEF